MNYEVKQIGSVAVDSGGLLITDPCYLRNWRFDGEEDTSSYIKDTKTGKIWCLPFHYDEKNGQDDINFFPGNYETPIPELDGLTPNELVASGQWIKLAREKQSLHEYSYNGYCNGTISPDWACSMHFELGHEGAGVAFGSGWGDGFYPVYAVYDNNQRIMLTFIDTGFRPIEWLMKLLNKLPVMEEE